MVKYKKRRIIVFLAVVGLLIFLYSLGLLGPIEGFFNRIFNPVSSGIHSLGSGLRTTYNEQTDKIDLLEENKRLNEKIVKLVEENADLKITKQENEVLREHLRFLTKNEHQFVMSNVLSRGDITDISDKSETLILDKGERDGIIPGLAVVSSKGVVIGKVAEVKDSISLVYLTNNSKCKMATTILGQEGTGGVIEGELGLTIRMGFIPQASEVNKDDIVVTSGLEHFIPRGLVVGQVMEVIKDNNELWQNAIIEPMIKSEDLIIVSVLLPFS